MRRMASDAVADAVAAKMSWNLRRVCAQHAAPLKGGPSRSQTRKHGADRLELSTLIRTSREAQCGSTAGRSNLPWKINVYPMLELRSGFAYQSVDVYQNHIQSMRSDSARLPTYFAGDDRVAKAVKLNSKYTLRPSISVTNITNHFNALQVDTNTADPQYGQVFGSYDRHERFDLDVVF